jgi:hypothetical protein
MSKTHFPPQGGYRNASLLEFYQEPGSALPADYTTGDAYWVNSVTGVNDTSHGRSPEAPFASLDYALSQTTNNNDDRIYLMPGHVETLTAAGSSAGNGGVFVGSVLSNGVSIIGLGNGRQRPVLNYTTAIGASMNIAASNVFIRNVVFTVNFDAITAMINVTGADVFFDSCEFILANATMSAALGILTAATATRLRVENSLFYGPMVTTGGTCAGAIQHESGVDYIIRRNAFVLKCTQAIKNVATVLRGLIDENRFVIGTGTVAVTMAAASTPFITKNAINVPSGTAPIVAAAGFVAGNVYSAAAGVTAGTASTF